MKSYYQISWCHAEVVPIIMLSYMYIHLFEISKYDMFSRYRNPIYSGIRNRTTQTKLKRFKSANKEKTPHILPSWASY